MANKKLDNLNNYEFVERISDLGIGKYKIFRYNNYNNSIDKFVLISVSNPEYRYYLNLFDTDFWCLYQIHILNY